ncbi:pickpocket protein 28-like [Condylostylus longicornis]|uniref:pickpocket protein 28-like n=1 Tax=Condylostylus longicornis TaxID=2530218 RepID=UPI00244E3D9C|nr:pickpocket protein 28-like [Condylostylus longicornis]
MGSGMRYGLEMMFSESKNNDDYDVTCISPIQGYQLVLHSANEFELLGLTCNFRRQCYFQKERYLKFFKKYNQRNCQTECLANHTVRKCGCVPYFMPKLKSTPICGLSNFECCHLAEKELNKLEYDDDFDDVVDGREEKCNCLPDCHSISYDTEINTVENNFKELLIKITKARNQSQSDEELEEKFKNFVSTKFFIYYKEDRFITSRRSELFSTTDIIAQCGGLLGLFMGVSLISLVEIVYFLTVRLFLNTRRS